MNLHKAVGNFLLTLALGSLLAECARCDVFGNGGNAFNIDFVSIGNAGNVADTTGTPEVAGSVAYDYRIGKYEISRSMIEKATAAGAVGLTLADMSMYGGNGPNKPAAGISWLEAAKFVNWLNTNTGHTPAYKFGSSGFETWQPSDPGYNPNNQFRNTQAYYFLPSSDEWYKAAFYNAADQNYFDYATGSNTAPAPTLGGTAPNTAVYISTNPANEVYQQMVGPADADQAGGLSPYGTMGQGGNLLEWEENDYYFLNDSTYYGRGVRGGFWLSVDLDLKSTYRDLADPNFKWPPFGFRVASVAAVVPEPSALYLTIIVAAVLAVGPRRMRN